IYDVPDDIAARFDCESRLTPGAPAKTSRTYGRYFGTTFRIAGPVKGTSIALLWAREDGYWKIVSWQTEPEPAETPPPPAPPALEVVRIKGDPALVQAAKDFLDTWLIRRNYDAAWGYFRPEATPATTSCGVLTLRRQPHPTMPAGGSVPASSVSANGSARRAPWRPWSRPPSRSIRRFV